MFTPEALKNRGYEEDTDNSASKEHKQTNQKRIRMNDSKTLFRDEEVVRSLNFGHEATKGPFKGDRFLIPKKEKTAEEWIEFLYKPSIEYGEDLADLWKFVVAGKDISKVS